MWAWLLAHTNTTRCSFSCLSTARLATPSNYFNHAFILPPACSTQLSWNSPGNYSKIRWEAELKHVSSGGHCAGLCRFPAGWGHLPVPHFSGLLHSLIRIIWRTHVWTEKEVTLCFSCAEGHTPNNIITSWSTALAVNSFCLLIRAQVKEMRRERRGQGDV